MKRVMRWIGIVCGVVLGLILSVVFIMYVDSELILRRREAKLDVAVPTVTDSGAAARGARLARIYGCHDCHGEQLTGRLFLDAMPVARLWGPNLTLLAARQSDQDLLRAIRTGVASDGRSLWIMPSSTFARLTPVETADILAYLRTFAPSGEPEPAIVMGPLARLGIVLRVLQSAPTLIRAERQRIPRDLGPQYALGRQLSQTCTECHGSDLTGSPATGAPDLAVAAGYDLPAFKKLLRTGEALGQRRLELMSSSAPERFRLFTDEEIEALFAYLKARSSLRQDLRTLGR